MNTAQAVQEKPEAKSNKVYKIALTGLFAALSYVVFHFYSLRSIFQAEMQLPSIWEMQSAF